MRLSILLVLTATCLALPPSKSEYTSYYSDNEEEYHLDPEEQLEQYEAEDEYYDYNEDDSDEYFRPESFDIGNYGVHQDFDMDEPEPQRDIQGEYTRDDDDEGGMNGYVRPEPLDNGNFGARHDFIDETESLDNQERECTQEEDEENGLDELLDHMEERREFGEDCHNDDNCQINNIFIDLPTINPSTNQGFSFFGMDGFQADDGQYFVDCDHAFSISSDPFTSWSPPNGNSNAKDNYKFFIISNDEWIIPSDGELTFVFQASAQVFGVEDAPFPRQVAEENDLRYGAGQIGVIDPMTGLSFAFIITNDRVYGLYQRSPEQRQIFNSNYAAFTLVFPLKDRDCAEHIECMSLSFHSDANYVTYNVADGKGFTLHSTGGLSLIHRFMVANYGGLEELVWPASLRVAFGTASYLDWYASIKNTELLATPYCPDSGRPELNIGLVRTSEEPPIFAPSFLGRGPAKYYDPYGTEECSHIWGQGVAMTIDMIQIVEKSCNPPV